MNDNAVYIKNNDELSRLDEIVAGFRSNNNLPAHTIVDIFLTMPDDPDRPFTTPPYTRLFAPSAVSRLVRIVSQIQSVQEHGNRHLGRQLEIKNHFHDFDFSMDADGLGITMYGTDKTYQNQWASGTVSLQEASTLAHFILDNIRDLSRS